MFDLGGLTAPSLADEFTTIPELELIDDAGVADPDSFSPLSDKALDLNADGIVLSPPRKRTKPNRSFVIVIALGIAILGLLPVLFYVISGG